MIKLKYKQLKYGELYLTTKEHTYSNVDEKYVTVTVPEGEKLLFRSFQPYGKKKNKNLALFFWLKHRISVCLCVSDKTPVLYLRHVEWEKRHEIEEENDVQA